MDDEHGRCPKCDADLNGGSIWEVGYQMALTDGKDTWPNVVAASAEEAEQRADAYASAYGATRTKGRWGRAIGISSMELDRIVLWMCPDCNHEWPR